jgi:uncharacterized RDD family membrane protein YckC
MDPNQKVPSTPLPPENKPAEPNQIPVPPPVDATPTPIPTPPDQTTDTKLSPPANIRYAGFGRLPAMLIDLILVIVISIPILLAIYYPGDVDQNTSNMIFGLVNLIYSVFFVSLKGATPGKMLLKMKIVDRNYAKPTFWRVLLRESVGKYVSGLLLLISGLMVIFQKQKRSLHDFIADTYVIYK